MGKLPTPTPNANGEPDCHPGRQDLDEAPFRYGIGNRPQIVTGADGGHQNEDCQIRAEHPPRRSQLGQKGADLSIPRGSRDPGERALQVVKRGVLPRRVDLGGAICGPQVLGVLLRRPEALVEWASGFSSNLSQVVFEILQ